MTREQDKHYKVRTTYIDYYVTRRCRRNSVR